jgi:dTMP kinase
MLLGSRRIWEEDDLMERGLYIMLESGEGLGKDYQADLLEPWLKQFGKVINTKEPGGTPEAEKIRKILLDPSNELDDLTELYLYQAARRDLNQKVVLPAIDSGEIVLCKRGFPSTHAYQGFGGGMDLNLIDNLNQRSMQGIMPDKIFIIDGDPEIGLARETDKDRFNAKGLPYHQKVREGYLDIEKRYPEITTIIPYLDGHPEKMQQQIQNELTSRFNL